MQATLLEDPGAQRQLVAALPGGMVPASNSTAGPGTLKTLGAEVGGADVAGDERVDKRGAGLMLACVPFVSFSSFGRIHEQSSCIIWSKSLRVI